MFADIPENGLGTTERLVEGAQAVLDVRNERGRARADTGSLAFVRLCLLSDPSTKVITLSTPLTTLYLHPSSPSSTLYQTLLLHLSPTSTTTSLPPTPPASPACSTTTSSTGSTSPTSPTSPVSQTRPKRVAPPSSFHTRPLSQISSHSATSTTSVTSIRSVSSFRSDWQPVWVKDDECAGCMVCGETWGWKRRRHHCRGESPVPLLRRDEPRFLSYSSLLATHSR